MDLPALYRKRYIPEETINLKDDTILHYDDTLIITSWRTLKPRSDIARGISAYFMEEGLKISKIYNRREELVYWYCDIIQTNKQPGQNAIIFEDLLLDILLYPDGYVKVLDMDELADAVEAGLITAETSHRALRTASRFLNLIYAGRFTPYMDTVTEAEKEEPETLAL